MTLSSPLTVVSLMNGMIGGVILVLPVASYQAGYLYTILAIIFSGAFSYYSCYLSIKHLGDQQDMNYSMQSHFRTKIAKILYDIVVWLGLLFGSIFYYGLICIQWQSILGKDTIAIPLVNAGVLFVLIFVLKYFDFGASLMAYGIISIFAYMAFLIWVVSTAPRGEIIWKPFGKNLYDFGATTSLAFAIQAFFIPVLMKNPLKSKHTLLTLFSYVIGGCIYFYISFMGSFGIINRLPLNQDPQTIEDYFKVGNIEVKII
jgi:hypothetical protein